MTDKQNELDELSEKYEDEKQKTVELEVIALHKYLFPKTHWNKKLKTKLKIESKEKGNFKTSKLCPKTRLNPRLSLQFSK